MNKSRQQQGFMNEEFIDFQTQAIILMKVISLVKLNDLFGGINYIDSD